MPCTISDAEIAYDALGAPVGLPGVTVSFQALELPLWVQVGDIRVQDETGRRETLAHLVDATWSVQLPLRSESTPAPTTWLLTRGGDGSQYSGNAPTEAGTYSVDDLINDWGWLVTSSGSEPVTLLQGPQGVPGPAGDPPPSASTAILANVDAATSTQLLLGADSRIGATLFNDGPLDGTGATLYVAFAAEASTTAFTVKLPPGGYFEFPQTPFYPGDVSGIWDGDAATVRITALYT